MQQHFLNNGMASIISAVIYKQELIHWDEISFFDYLILIGQSWAFKYFCITATNISIPFQTNTSEKLKEARNENYIMHVIICSKHNLLSYVGHKRRWEMFQCSFLVNYPFNVISQMLLDISKRSQDDDHLNVQIWRFKCKNTHIHSFQESCSLFISTNLCVVVCIVLHLL